MRGPVTLAVPVLGAALAFGGLAVAVAPSAAACGGYGEPACQTFTLTFNVSPPPGFTAACNPSTVSGLEGSTVNLLGPSQCSGQGMRLIGWSSAGQTFSVDQPVVLSGNRGFTAIWTSFGPSPTATASPTPTGGTASPTASPSPSPTVTRVPIPPGQTNPNTPQSPAPGVTVVSQAVADFTAVTRVPRQGSSGSARRNPTDVEVGSVFQADVRVVRRGDYGIALQTPSGTVVRFGRKSAIGRSPVVTTPAIRYTEDGTYLWTVGDGPRTTYFAVRVS